MKWLHKLSRRPRDYKAETYATDDRARTHTTALAISFLFLISSAYLGDAAIIPREKIAVTHCHICPIKRRSATTTVATTAAAVRVNSRTARADGDHGHPWPSPSFVQQVPCIREHVGGLAVVLLYRNVRILSAPVRCR